VSIRENLIRATNALDLARVQQAAGDFNLERREPLNELDRELLQKYPLHIVLMVKAAKAALDKGQARIENGTLMMDAPSPAMSLTQTRRRRSLQSPSTT
jgi:hypothetical protein